MGPVGYYARLHFISCFKATAENLVEFDWAFLSHEKSLESETEPFRWHTVCDLTQNISQWESVHWAALIYVSLKMMHLKHTDVTNSVSEVK